MNIPAPLPTLDAESFRRDLAGLIDTDRSAEYSPSQFKESAARLCFVLAKCYNRDQLDAVNLWSRIGSAIETACAKVDDGDLDRLVSIALEFVKAEPSKVAADETTAYALADLTEQPESWQLGFVRYLKSHLYPSIVHGRRLWELHKETKGGVS